MAWRGAFNDCTSERNRSSQLCQLSSSAGVASFENRQRAADTQLMFSSSVSPAAAGTERFAEDHYTPWSVQSEQRQRLAEEASQIHRDITATLNEHVPQEELLRTLLSINEEVARWTTAAPGWRLRRRRQQPLPERREHPQPRRGGPGPERGDVETERTSGLPSAGRGRSGIPRASASSHGPGRERAAAGSTSRRWPPRTAGACSRTLPNKKKKGALGSALFRSVERGVRGGAQGTTRWSSMPVRRQLMFRRRSLMSG